MTLEICAASNYEFGVFLPNNDEYDVEVHSMDEIDEQLCSGMTKGKLVSIWLGDPDADAIHASINGGDACLDFACRDGIFCSFDANKDRTPAVAFLIASEV